MKKKNRGNKCINIRKKTRILRMFRRSYKGSLCSVTLLQQSPNPQTNERERERDFTTSDLRVHEREDEGRRDGDVD